MEVIWTSFPTDEAERQHREGKQETCIDQTNALNRPEVRRLLAWTIQGHEKITPVPLKKGDRFPQVTKLLGDSEQVVPLLEELVSHGIFQRVTAHSEPACPDCKSTQIYDRCVCPYCEGQNLEKGRRIQHHTCGHADFETRFQRDEGLTCPKCGKELRLIGTDYQRIENIFHCHDCRRDFSIPQIIQTCMNCNTTFPHEKADLKSIHGYTFNEDKRREVITHCLIELPIIRLLEAQGYNVTAPGTLKGRSSTEHIFDIIANRDGKTLAFDLVAGPTERDSKPVLTFFGKSYDVPSERAVLIAMPRLSKDAKKLAETYGTEYIEGEDMEEILKAMPTLFTEQRLITSLLKQTEALEPQKTERLDPRSPTETADGTMAEMHARIRKILEQDTAKEFKLSKWM